MNMLLTKHTGTVHYHKRSTKFPIIIVTGFQLKFQQWSQKMNGLYAILFGTVSLTGKTPYNLLSSLK